MTDLVALTAEKREVLQQSTYLTGDAASHPLNLKFDSVRVALRRQNRAVLRGAWGDVDAGELACVIGPSGWSAASRRRSSSGILCQ